MAEKRIEYNMENRERFAGKRDRWNVWEEQPNEKHSWAFIHHARRDGYPVIVEVNGELVRIAIFMGEA